MTNVDMRFVSEFIIQKLSPTLFDGLTDLFEGNLSLKMLLFFSQPDLNCYN